MNVTFTPKSPGTRNGTAVLYDTTGNAIATTYLLGTGVGLTVANPPNFGSVNIGTPSTPLPVVINFYTATTFGSPAVLTQGATGLDFADAGTGTCKNGTQYYAGQTCTMNVAFTPKFAGTRNGAVVLYDNNGNAIATAYLQGTGVGPQINFLPGIQSTLGSGFYNPMGVAVDGNGNVFVGDVSNGVVKEILAVNGTIPALPTILSLGSFSDPHGVAVDGAGNVYVADPKNNTVSEILAVNGSIPVSPTIRTLGSGFYDPSSVAIDTNGNVYVAEPDISTIAEIVAVNGSIPVSPTIRAFCSGFNYPIGGVAVDGSGNVYVGDTYNGSVKEMLAVNGSIPDSPTINTLVSNIVDPEGIAVDGNGNVYFVDINNTVKELMAVNGSIPASPAIITLASGLNFPYGVAVDSSLNVYIADTDNNRIVKLDYVDAPSLTFANTTFGSTSSDSPQTVTIQNAGNAPLTFPILSTGNNPSIATNFTLDSSGTSACPLVGAGSSTPGTLAAGASCQLPISFTPTSAGALSGSLALTDNNLNAAATQTITLSGTGTQATPSITWATPAAIISGTALSATQLNAKASVAGKFVYSPAAGTIPAVGTDTLTVTFTPTDATDYTTATGSVQLKVNPAPSFTLGASPTSLTVDRGASEKTTVTVTGQNGFTGKVTLAASGLPSGVTATFATNPTTGSSALTLKASSTAAVGSATITVKGTSGSLTANTIFGLTVSCTPTTIVPYISINGGSTWTKETSATVSSTSANVDLGPQPTSGGSWSWTGPNKYTSTSRQINKIPLTVGTDSYVATYTNTNGCKSNDTFTITVK
jgi:sugar lactone lactonase YvrE